MDQQQNERVTNKLFKILCKFERGNRLQNSNAGSAQRAVQAIRWRLCPNTKFKNFHEIAVPFEVFKSSSVLAIPRRPTTGVVSFFMRPDSPVRYGEQRPPKCPRQTRRRRSAGKREEARGEIMCSGFATCDAQSLEGGPFSDNLLFVFFFGLEFCVVLACCSHCEET